MMFLMDSLILAETSIGVLLILLQPSLLQMNGKYNSDLVVMIKRRCGLMVSWFLTYTQNRYAVVDDEIIPVTLNPGKNTILVKVCNEERTWGFYMRVTDTDGKPYEDLEFNRPQK